MYLQKVEIVMETVENERPIIAAFDFDGTLTYRDTLIDFLFFVVGPFKTIFYLLLQVPTLLAFVFGMVTRQQTKERILEQFFEGMPLEELKKKGKAFAKERLFRRLRPEGLLRLQWHLHKGHRCILISASLDVYLEHWAQFTGFHDALTSRLAADDEGKVTGKLVGLNCRSEEKVRRLKDLLGSLDNYQIYAYGDSKGDKELLEVADYPFYRKMPAG